MTALEIIENTIPTTVQSEVKRGWKINAEAKRAKILKYPKVAMPDIVNFNAYMQAAIYNFEMAEHIYEKNMIEAYYYQSVMEAVSKTRETPITKFDKYRSKEIIFRIFPKFGRTTSS